MESGQAPSAPNSSPLLNKRLADADAVVPLRRVVLEADTAVLPAPGSQRLGSGVKCTYSRAIERENSAEPGADCACSQSNTVFSRGFTLSLAPPRCQSRTIDPAFHKNSKCNNSDATISE